LNLIGPKATFANLGYTWNSYRYFKGTGKDMDTHNLNAVIGIKLLKDQMTVSFSGHDLLNSGSIYTMSTSSNYLSQTWTPSYGRYFMLNISFRLNRLGKNVRSMGRMSDGSANHKIIL
jgi:outer membrane receptor protein involved in Fe transport